MNMYIIAVFAVLATAAALPTDVIENKKEAVLLSSESVKNPDGSYKTAVKIDNGIDQNEEGTLREVVDAEKVPHTVVVVRGQYTAFDQDGKPSIITYEADENGFRATGVLIPKENTSEV